MDFSSGGAPPSGPLALPGMPQPGGADGTMAGPGAALLANPQLRNQLIMNMMAQQAGQMDQSAGGASARPAAPAAPGGTGGLMGMLGQGGLMQALGGQGGLMSLLQRIGQSGATPMGQGGIGHA